MRIEKSRLTSCSVDRRVRGRLFRPIPVSKTVQWNVCAEKLADGATCIDVAQVSRKCCFTEHLNRRFLDKRSAAVAYAFALIDIRR